MDGCVIVKFTYFSEFLFEPILPDFARNLLSVFNRFAVRFVDVRS